MTRKQFISSLLPGLLKAQPGSVVDGNTAFALKLYKQLAKPAENVFLSPYNISSALAMTYAGARGQTAAEMAKALEFGAPESTVAGFGQLERSLQSKPAPDLPGHELFTGNRLWGRKQLPFSPQFLSLLSQGFQAGLEEVDFAKAPETARQRINAWVEEQTRKKIVNLLPRESVSRDTALVLTAAIYFKARWARTFETSMTKPGPFFVRANQKVQAPMMHQISRGTYFEDASVLGLELPYLGGLSMLLILPRKVDGLAEVENTLTPAKLKQWRGSLKMGRVDMTIPKFKIAQSYELTDPLSALGMRSAFTTGADFSGMLKPGVKERLLISKVLHKAFVDVNEEGTEAAAATAVMAELTSAMPQKPVVFRADHPFLFFIQDRKSGSVLFLGRVANPAIAAG